MLDEIILQTQINAMVRIEFELALITTPNSDTRNGSLQYNSRTVAQAWREFESLNWSSFFAGMLASNRTGDQPPLDEFNQRFILVEVETYMPKLNDWLRSYNNDANKMKDLVNYIMYRLILAYMTHASSSIEAFNYGAMGALIGHELTHGFDDEGIQFDANATLHTWMNEKSQRGFKEMAQCVVDEYNQFCYPQGCLDGVDTQGENIADNAGLKAAYYAYKRRESRDEKEKCISDFPTYSMDQIFFISYAYSWCGQVSEDYLTRQLLADPHAPYRERVNGVVKTAWHLEKRFIGLARHRYASRSVVIFGK